MSKKKCRTTNVIIRQWVYWPYVSRKCEYENKNYKKILYPHITYIVIIIITARRVVLISHRSLR